MIRSFNFDCTSLMGLAPIGTNREGPNGVGLAVARAAIDGFCRTIAASGLPRAERQSLIEDALDAAQGLLGDAADFEAGEMAHDAIEACYEGCCLRHGRLAAGEPEHDDMIEALSRSQVEWDADDFHLTIEE